MHEKANQHSADETSKQNDSKKIEPERPEKLDKEHGEEVQTSKEEGKVAVPDK